MSTKDDEGLPELGQVRLGPVCPHGRRHYRYVDDAGEVRDGHARMVADGTDPLPAGDYERTAAKTNGNFAVRRPHAGPARVSSRAYRSGWDKAFGRHAGKAS